MRILSDKVVTGQVLLVVCCVFYLIWWYRGFRPGITVNRVGGVNGILLVITAAFGIAGVVMSLWPTQASQSGKISFLVIIAGGIIAYVILLLITKLLFQRVVTSELFLIVGWTMLELAVLSKLNAAGTLGDKDFYMMCLVIAAAFLISMVLYVAYYRMEEMKAFYAAMVPLVTEGLSMMVLIILAMQGV